MSVSTNGKTVTPTGPSPLQQVERPPVLTSKFEVMFKELFTGQPPSVFSPKSANNGKGKGDIPAHQRGYYRTLFCLKPNSVLITEMVRDASVEQILGPLKVNVGDLFTTAVDVLNSKESDELTRQNAVEVS